MRLEKASVYAASRVSQLPIYLHSRKEHDW